MKDVHIIDAHALLAVDDVTHPDHVAEVFTALAKMVKDKSLTLADAVIKALDRLEPNGTARIWAGAIVEARQYTKIPYNYYLEAQDLAQKAGYDEGLEDSLTERTSGTLQTASLACYLAHLGHRPTVVTEDWSEKPLRPALGTFCEQVGWPTVRLTEFLEQRQLGDWLR